MKKLVTLLAVPGLGVVAFYLAATFVGRSDAPPPTPPITVPGPPAAVYDAILPEIRDRIARETKIVRLDGPDGAITMRFTAHLEDHSVRLVEVVLAPTPPAATGVSIASRRFSFLPGRVRDTADATLETSIGTLIRTRAAP